MPRRKKEEQPKEEIKVIKTPPLVMGMKDILPSEYKYWEYLEWHIQRVIDDYSFKKISTPVLEKYELFNHTLYKQSGLAEKELFSFIDRGEKLALRPEATSSIARAFVDHNMANQQMPLKVYYRGPMFRQGKVDVDKYRQFEQVGFEVIGEKSPAIDAEQIIIAHYLLLNLGLKTQVRLNSLGCVVCRLEYSKALSGYLKSKRAAVCGDCRKRVTRDPMKFLTCDSPKCHKVKEDAPQTVDWLCDDCRNHLFRVLEYLDELKIPYTLDSSLLRSFDFYNKTVFEITTIPAESTEEKPVVLAGGGRYDYLIQMVGGPEMPAAGFALGLDRLVNQMKKDRSDFESYKEVDVFVCQLSEQARQKVFAFYEKLRQENFRVRANFSHSSLKAQLDIAKKLNAKLVLIFGQKEANEGTVLFRDLDSGIQEVVSQTKVIRDIKKKLKEKRDKADGLK